MRPLYKNIITYLPLVCFFLYWIPASLWILTEGTPKSYLKTHIPRLRGLLGNSWRTFSPPYTFNYRLYYISRSGINTSVIDTVEVLQSLSEQKQLNAPFNHAEDITDHLLQNTVIGLVATIWKKEDLFNQSTNVDKDVLAAAIANAAANKNYGIHLASLKNYGKQLVKKSNLFSKVDSMKIVIAKKMIRPFREMDNMNYQHAEVIIFDTPFEPLLP